MVARSIQPREIRVHVRVWPKIGRGKCAFDRDVPNDTQGGRKTRKERRKRVTRVV